MALNDTPHSITIRGETSLDRIRRGLPAVEPKPRAKGPSFEDKLRAAVARLKDEPIRRDGKSYFWDGNNAPIPKGFATSLISCGYAKPDASTAIFDDGLAPAQLYVWSGKAFQK